MQFDTFHRDFVSDSVSQSEDPSVALTELGIAILDPDVQPDELVKLLRTDSEQLVTASHDGFVASCRSIFHIHLLHLKTSAAETNRISGATVGGAAFKNAAKAAGVGKSVAYRVIQLDAYSKIPTILARVKAEVAKLPRVQADSYLYPSMNKILTWCWAWCRPEDDQKERRPSAKELRRELEHTESQLSSVARELARRTAELTFEREAHYQDSEHLERELAAKNAKIHDLELQVERLSAHLEERTIGSAALNAAGATISTEASVPAPSDSAHSVEPRVLSLARNPRSSPVGVPPDAEVGDDAHAQLEARRIVGQRLGVLTEADAAVAEAEISEWESTAGPLPHFRGAVGAVRLARHYRKRALQTLIDFVGAAQANVDDNAVQLLRDVRSAGWWREHGASSLDLLVVAARERAKSPRGQTSTANSDEAGVGASASVEGVPSKTD